MVLTKRLVSVGTILAPTKGRKQSNYHKLENLKRVEVVNLRQHTSAPIIDCRIIEGSTYDSFLNKRYDSGEIIDINLTHFSKDFSNNINNSKFKIWF